MIKNFAILALFIGSFAYGQDLPSNLYGSWINQEGELLKVRWDNSFERITSSRILAVGKLENTVNGLKINRLDTKESYNLVYYVGRETFTVFKPNSKEAWLFTKIGN